MAVEEFFVCGEAGPGGRGAGVNQAMLISQTSQGRAAGPSQGWDTATGVGVLPIRIGQPQMFHTANGLMMILSLMHRIN